MAGIVVLVALVLRLVLVFVIKRSVRVLTAKQNTREPDAELGLRARQILTRAGGLASQRQKQRIATLGSLLRNVVELHRRIARGFRNRDNYRLRMLLIGGGLTPPPPPEV